MQNLKQALVAASQTPALWSHASVTLQRLEQAIQMVPHQALKQQMLQALSEMLQNMGPSFLMLRGAQWARRARISL